jgi:hypothetical protein
LADKTYWLDPLTDRRWDRLVAEHPSSSVFHTCGWLEALKRTYGFEPRVVTTTPPGRELCDGIVVCEVASWITGRRLVSLPFSDHCEPLVRSATELEPLLNALTIGLERSRNRYVEIRPRSTGFQLPPASLLSPSQSFCFHHLDLGPPLESIFDGFHKDCVQRKIRRAERDRLEYSEGVSRPFLETFFGLQLMTRRRQKLPPQPFRWFANVAELLGDRVKIRVASKDGRPVASILTLRHRNTMVYKYGCSDERFSAHGGTQLLFWKAIQEAKTGGMAEYDMGRSDADNPGLLDFKDRWGATRSTLTYLRFPAKPARTGPPGPVSRMAKNLVACLPDRALAAAGSLLYRHAA